MATVSSMNPLKCGISGATAAEIRDGEITLEQGPSLRGPKNPAAALSPILGKGK